MKQNWTKAILSALVITSIFSSCKPTPDTDTPFPPAISPSVFIASDNAKLFALDPATGTKKWECQIGAEVKSSPVLYGGTLFVGNSSSILFKVDPNTGVRDQSKIGFPLGIYTVPIGHDNFLFVGSGTDITCIDIKPDTVEWKFTASGAITTSPTIKDTQLVFGSSDGFVYMIDRRDGKLIWKSISYTTPFGASPTIDTGHIYIGNENGGMYALKRKDGTEAWGGPYMTPAPIKSSPIIYGGNIFFGCDNSKLYCLDIISGTPRWTRELGARIISSPYLKGQTIYVGSYDKSFYAINTLDGTVKWSYLTKGLIANSPVVYNSNVFFGSADLNLYALDTAKGTLSWKYTVNGLMDTSPSIDPNNTDGNGINSSVSGASIH